MRTLGLLSSGSRLEGHGTHNAMMFRDPKYGEL